MVTDQRDKGCICDYYGGDQDLRRAKDSSCPWHGDKKVAHTQEYIIPKGTLIQRAYLPNKKNLWSSEDLRWETFTTTRAVRYEATELTHIEKVDTGDAFGVFWRFMFRLPPEAFPYERIRVDDHLISIVDTKDVKIL